MTDPQKRGQTIGTDPVITNDHFSQLRAPTALGNFYTVPLSLDFYGAQRNLQLKKRYIYMYVSALI